MARAYSRTRDTFERTIALMWKPPGEHKQRVFCKSIGGAIVKARALRREHGLLCRISIDEFVSVANTINWEGRNGD